jgi:hypothetical protein
VTARQHASLAETQKFGRCWRESGSRTIIANRSFVTQSARLLRNNGATQHVQCSARRVSTEPGAGQLRDVIEQRASRKFFEEQAQADRPVVLRSNDFSK